MTDSPRTQPRDAFAANLVKYVRASEEWRYDLESLWATIMADFDRNAEEAASQARQELEAEVSRLRAIVKEVASDECMGCGVGGGGGIGYCVHDAARAALGPTQENPE
jgi:hypothetical protein